MLKVDIGEHRGGDTLCSILAQGTLIEIIADVGRVIADVHTQLKRSNPANDVLVTFTDPHHSYAITGGTITGSGANWVTITATGEVTLTGKKYIHSTVRYSQRNTEATASERNNVFAAEEATLVHSGNVDAVLKRLFDIAQFRQTLTQEAVVSTQRAGQKVTSENPWGELLQGYITSMESDLTPTGHTASVTILGAELNYDGYQYTGRLRSGDTEGLY